MTNRRSFLTTLGMGYAIANVSARAQSQSAARPAGAARNNELFYTAKTQYGKVQGMANAGIKEFKGVPYGAPTGGKNRYLPPKNPPPGPASANAMPTDQSRRKRWP